ncbi:MAG TPA: hypothetical protein PKZ97_12565 [Azospirillaceae bacterium]|nr:hypothetical protein [Azospirillaceae bacterium]HRQ81940.1 hypothetical protein [Azospirillaceae bacterium]
MSKPLDRAAPICAPTFLRQIVPFPASRIVQPVPADAAPSPMGGMPGMFVVWRHPDPALLEAAEIARRYIDGNHPDWPAADRQAAVINLASRLRPTIARRQARLSDTPVA